MTHPDRAIQMSDVIAERTTDGKRGYVDGWKAGVEQALERVAAGQSVEDARIDCDHIARVLDSLLDESGPTDG